jgi:TonB-linked outer membrane protein, SusC/RagA family
MNKIKLLFLVLALCFYSSAFCQQKKISVSLNQVTVKEALDAVKKQAEISYWFEAKDLDLKRIVTINLKNKSLAEVLNQILAGQDVHYTIKGNSVIIAKGKKSQTSDVQTEDNQSGILKNVTGTIHDEKGQPLIGVSVRQKGSSVGTVSDVNGQFKLEAKSNVVLIFSYIGYISTEVAVNGKSNLTVEMAEDLKKLDEVVVVGYGTVKRRDLTGAVASVKGETVAATPVANVAQAIQGKLPGVNVTTQDGRPGANVSIRVRGGGSITQSNDPLYIVDGFPVSNINDLSSSEIESIDVLKDASSTAIYGARGANGVILITTKSGKAGKTKVTYDGYAQFKNAAKTLETLSAQDYVLFNWSYAASRGTANQDAVEKYFGLGSKYGNHYSEYANVKAHDYTDDILRTAYTQSHTVTISGGNDNTKIFSNIGYIADQGIKINSDYNRMNASLKVQQKLTSNLNLDMDMRYTEENLNGNEGVTNGKGSNVSAAYRYRPIDNPLGGVSYSDVASGFSFGVANIDDKHNPVLLINDITNKSLSQNLRGSAALSWEIIHGLTARTEASVGRSTSKSTYYENGYTNGDKRATLSRGMGNSLRSTSTLNYNLDINKDNKLTLLLGNEVLKFSGESSQISGRGYPDNFDYNTTMGLIQTATSSLSSSYGISVPTSTLSYFGRMNYSLLSRYLLTATFRADGSSKFAPNNRWGYFPAAALAWRISDESFMENTKEWLSNLKLRFSLGTIGSDNISSNLWQETWSSIGSSGNHTPINGKFISYYRPDGLLANPDLKWETTISRNIGIDYGFWGNKINGSIELYKNTTKDLLMAVPVDNTTGYSYQFQNFGKTSNRGIELSVNADVVNTKDFRFNLGLIYNYNMNRLDEMPNADQYLYSSNWASSALMPKNDYMFIQGRPIGVIRGYVSEGYYTVNDFTYTNGKYVLKSGVPDISSAVTATYKHPFSLPTGQTAFPGCVKFKDVSGDGKVDLNDATDLGDAMAHHTGSFSLNFTYKSFDLSSNFNWVLGGKIYNVAAMINASGEEYDGIGAQRTSWVSSAYKIYNVNSSGNLYAVTDPTELNTLNASAKHAVPFQQSGITSSEWIEDGSYLRLQTLTLGYTLPEKLVKKMHINNFRVYATASNLFTISKYSGIDPEVNSSPIGQAGFTGNLRVFPTLNMDFGSYPRARTFTLGANVTF